MFHIFKVSKQCEPVSDDVRIVTVVLLTIYGYRQTQTLEYFKEPMVEPQAKT